MVLNPGTISGRETQADTLPASQLTPAQRIRAIVAGSACNLIEWYDFFIYAFLSIYFASSFFPEGDRTAQLLNVTGIFAAGFLIRPLGGWYFGRLADRRGRRISLVISVLLMGFGSLLIAFLPTYAQVGALAPILLLLARLCQGFATGGQYGAVATYLSEIATNKQRGFVSSFQFVTLIGGQLLALCILLLLQSVMDDATISEWGWRIPFILGAILAGTVILFQHLIHETVTESAHIKEAGTLRGLAAHPKAFLCVISLTAAGAISLYTFTTYMQKFLVNTAGMDARLANGVMTGAIIVFMLLQPAIGALSDRIGRRTCLLIFSGAMTLGAAPILFALSSIQSGVGAFMLITSALIILSFYTSISGLFKAELFPAHVRALGVGFAHSLSAAIFGGSVEYLALLFKQSGIETMFYWYVAGSAAIAFVTALLMPEPSRSFTQN